MPHPGIFNGFAKYKWITRQEIFRLGIFKIYNCNELLEQRVFSYLLKEFLIMSEMSSSSGCTKCEIPNVMPTRFMRSSFASCSNLNKSKGQIFTHSSFTTTMDGVKCIRFNEI